MAERVCSPPLTKASTEKRSRIRRSSRSPSRLRTGIVLERAWLFGSPEWERSKVRRLQSGWKVKAVKWLLSWANFKVNGPSWACNRRVKSSVRPKIPGRDASVPVPGQAAGSAVHSGYAVPGAGSFVQTSSGLPAHIWQNPNPASRQP